MRNMLAVAFVAISRSYLDHLRNEVISGTKVPLEEDNPTAGIKSGPSPLQQRISRTSLRMMLEDAFDLGTNFNGLHRIAQQVANHANTSMW
jgi:hypothetical protein